MKRDSLTTYRTASFAGRSAQVQIPSGDWIVGDPLPRRVRELLLDHLGEIRAAWNQMNPGRTI
jgi:hypothetical protein